MIIEKIEEYKIYSETRFTKKDMINEEKAVVFTLNLKPGQQVPPHKHGESGLIIHVLTGSGSLSVDNELRDVKYGDVIYCNGQEVFSLKNTSEENISCFGVLTR